MAKFTSGDLRLKDSQKVTWGTILDSNIWWDGANNELRLDTTISGVDPIQSYQLTTKQYVDNAVAAVSGTVENHNELLNIQGGATNDYYHLTLVQHTDLTDGGDATIHHHDGRYFRENEFISTSSGVGDAGKPIILNGVGLIDGSFIDESAIDHGLLTGLGDDDHTIYSLVDGTRAFTGTVGGITPTASNHLTTKQYVDAVAQGVDWQDSVLSLSGCTPPVSPSVGDRYIVCSSSGTGDWSGLEDNVVEYDGATWSGTEPNEGFAAWVEDEDALYIYNDVYPTGEWVKFGSTVTHNNLSGIQGGTTDEYYHLTSAQFTGLTDDGGVANASDQHIHDDRYYTETEVDTISGSLQTQIDSHTHTDTDITNFDEAAQDAVGGIMVGAGTVTVTYNDIGNTITVSGSTSGGVSDHGGLSGLGDDDHAQYVPIDGSRGFTSTVSGVDPTQDYHLTTKSYVDTATASGGIDRHGRESISNGASTVTVNFADLGHTNYTVNTTMENTADSPPSIYAFIVSARTSSSFIVTFMGDMDSANYKLNWSIIED